MGKNDEFEIWYMDELISPTTFLILSHKIHIFFVSRNHFTFMFGGHLQFIKATWET